MRFVKPYLINFSPLVLIEEILRKEREGFAAKTLLFLLYPLSLCYGLGVKLRNLLYDKGTLRQEKCKALVVSVGNVVAGGTGKTPFILMLAKKLMQEMPLAVLSRGYLGASENKGQSTQVAQDGSALQFGDEPLLLAQNLDKAGVYVGKDRVKSAHKAVEQGAKVILLDDGMQHRRLHRDIEIVMVHGKDPFCGGRYLPGGLLRDDPKQLKRADYIISSGGPVNLSKWTKAPVIEIKNAFREVVFADGSTKSSLKGCKVALFCAISHPQRFIKSIQDKAEVVAVTLLPDHEKISFESLKQFALKSRQKGAEFLLCTEKDFVKLDKQELRTLSIPVGFVRSEAIVTNNEQAFLALIEKIKRGTL